MHIDLLTRLNVTRQAHNLLLRFRHRRHAPVQFGFFIFQRLTFFQQRAVRRVRFGEEFRDFRFFKGQFVKLRINVNH